MKAIANWKDIPMSNDKGRLPEGGYVVEMTEIRDDAKKECLEVRYDITEGPEAGRYSDDFYKDKPYAHRMFRSYKETALRMFKTFITAVDETNGTAFNAELEKGKAFNEQKLKGKKLGIVVSYEEYENDRGEIKQRPYVAKVLSAQAVRAGEYTVPDLKKLSGSASNGTAGLAPAPDVPFGQPISDDDLPF